MNFYLEQMRNVQHAEHFCEIKQSSTHILESQMQALLQQRLYYTPTKPTQQTQIIWLIYPLHTECSHCAKNGSPLLWTWSLWLHTIWSLQHRPIFSYNVQGNKVQAH